MDNHSLFAGILFFSWIVAFITAFFVPDRYVWITVYYCLLAGLSAGVASGSLPVGFFGLVVVTVMAQGGQLNRYHRVKAWKKLFGADDESLNKLRDSTSRWNE